MRKKNKSWKHPLLTPPLLPRFNFTPEFSTSSQTAVQGDGEWGLLSLCNTLSLLHLPPQGEDSSHSFPTPAWGPSHRRQSSTNFSNRSPSHGLQLLMNCSNVSLFHEVPSFRNRLLQRGSYMDSQVLPANLLHHWLLSPWGNRSWQEPAPGWASHRITAPIGHMHLLQCGGLHGLHVDICSTVDLCGLQVYSLPHYCAWLHGNHRSGAWSTSSLSFWPWCLQSSHSSFKLQMPLSRFFFSFVNTWSQRCYHYCWLAQPWPEVG